MVAGKEGEEEKKEKKKEEKEIHVDAAQASDRVGIPCKHNVIFPLRRTTVLAL